MSVAPETQNHKSDPRQNPQKQIFVFCCPSELCVLLADIFEVFFLKPSELEITLVFFSQTELKFSCNPSSLRTGTKQQKNTELGHRILEYPRLDETHKDPQVQLLVHVVSAQCSIRRF